MEDSAFKNHGGEGIWQDIENIKTGERSLKEHKLKVVWKSCDKDKCFFEVLKPSKREATCRDCGLIKNFVLGIHSIADGKIVNLR